MLCPIASTGSRRLQNALVYYCVRYQPEPRCQWVSSAEADIFGATTPSYDARGPTALQLCTHMDTLAESSPVFEDIR
jgi:hypothetical protein